MAIVQYRAKHSSSKSLFTALYHHSMEHCSKHVLVIMGS